MNKKNSMSTSEMFCQEKKIKKKSQPSPQLWLEMPCWCVKRFLIILFGSIVANDDFFKNKTRAFQKFSYNFHYYQVIYWIITLSCWCSIRLRKFCISSGCYANFVFKNYVYLSKFKMVLNIYNTIFLLVNHLYKYELGCLVDTHQCFTTWMFVQGSMRCQGNGV